MELREWQYINKPTANTTSAASTSSTGYKKRFEKLIKYHIDHASSELESITKKIIRDYSFLLGEHYNTGKNEFDRSIIVAVDKITGASILTIFIDGKEVYHNDYKSYEEVLEILTGSYMYLPDQGTSEWDGLLTESLTEWQLMNPPTNNSSQQAQATASSKPQSQVKRYSKLLKQIDADGLSTRRINKFNDTTLDITVNTAKRHDLNLRMEYQPATDDYIFTVDGKTSKGWAWFEDILELLITGGVIKNTNLCESSSFADDFKLYENLWN